MPGGGAVWKKGSASPMAAEVFRVQENPRRFQAGLGPAAGPGLLMAGCGGQGVGRRTLCRLRPPPQCAQRLGLKTSDFVRRHVQLPGDVFDPLLLAVQPETHLDDTSFARRQTAQRVLVILAHRTVVLQ